MRSLKPMKRDSRHLTSRLALSAFVLMLLWIAGAVTTNVVKYHPVYQAQQDMIARIQKAHLLGARKQNVIVFSDNRISRIRNTMVSWAETDGKHF